MKGFTGKILRVDLTTRKISTIDTAKYEKWGGGHGIGSAIFWDLCPDKNISGFDPRNVVTIMTSPLSGSLAPSVSGRTEVQGIGVQSYPVEWFTRGNFGGRFSAMLKYAGWDGVVIEGKADGPVWVDIRDDEVQIKDAKSLWGLDTQQTQEEIWREVQGTRAGADWWQNGNARDNGRTTQRPAVLTIGPAGENLSRMATLTHDAGNTVGQGGFGAVWGAKNLKAISVIGTGSVKVADPKALMDARLWMARTQTYNVDDPVTAPPIPNFPLSGTYLHQPGYGPITTPTSRPSRPQGCVGCYINCRRRTSDRNGNETQCVESLYYTVVNDPTGQLKSADLIQKLGINAYEMYFNPYLRELYKMGVLGRGKKIHSELPFEKFGSYEFIEALCNAIAYRKDIGKDLAEGFVRAAKKWGRLEQDLNSGLLPAPNWGYHEHYDPRAEVEWSYGSILGDRDINEHDFNSLVHWMPTVTALIKQQPLLPAEEIATRMARKIGGDPKMFDYSEEGIYSNERVKEIAWHRHYTRFWKQSAMYCDWAWPNFVNFSAPDFDGASPEAEPKFYNAVTGANMTFEEGMELGRKIWNLDRAIWILQGRHRDMEVHAGYVYNVPIKAPYFLPAFENGKWGYSMCLGRKLDRAKFEDWKTRYYKYEGWDPATGWPTRKTLEELELGFVADELEKNGKLGK